MATLIDILQRPALPPPPGVVPNFANPDNIRVALIVTSVLCLFISTLSFWIRAYTRFYIFKETEWEDCNFFFGCLVIEIFTDCV